MGSGSFDSTSYYDAVARLKATGTSFARAAAAKTSHDFSNIADILNPRKMKSGVRESCFPATSEDVIPIIVSIDATGSMQTVPGEICKELPNLVTLITEQGISEHPNVMFMCHDDEYCMPDAAFQISQFELEAPKLLEALNELVLPGQGGGNRGEAYHISFYASARHTRTDAFDKKKEKGFFFMICDEQPYYDAKNPAHHGMKPALAKNLFNDDIAEEVPMLDSVRRTLEKYHVFILRPEHTSNGKDKSISKLWQDLLQEAGGNPQNVLEVEHTDALVSTMVMAIGSITGVDTDELVDVLRVKGATGVSSAVAATRAIAAVGSKAIVAHGKASTEITTTAPGRTRR